MSRRAGVYGGVAGRMGEANWGDSVTLAMQEMELVTW